MEQTLFAQKTSTKRLINESEVGNISPSISDIDDFITSFCRLMLRKKNGEDLIKWAATYNKTNPEIVDLTAKIMAIGVTDININAKGEAVLKSDDSILREVKSKKNLAQMFEALYDSVKNAANVSIKQIEEKSEAEETENGDSFVDEEDSEEGLNSQNEGTEDDIGDELLDIRDDSVNIDKIKKKREIDDEANDIKKIADSIERPANLIFHEAATNEFIKNMGVIEEAEKPATETSATPAINKDIVGKILADVIAYVVKVLPTGEKPSMDGFLKAKKEANKGNIYYPNNKHELDYIRKNLSKIVDGVKSGKPVDQIAKIISLSENDLRAGGVHLAIKAAKGITNNLRAAALDAMKEAKETGKIINEHDVILEAIKTPSYVSLAEVEEEDVAIDTMRALLKEAGANISSKELPKVNLKAVIDSQKADLDMSEEDMWYQKLSAEEDERVGEDTIPIYGKDKPDDAVGAIKRDKEEFPKKRIISQLSDAASIFRERLRNNANILSVAISINSKDQSFTALIETEQEQSEVEELAGNFLKMIGVKENNYEIEEFDSDKDDVHLFSVYFFDIMADNPHAKIDYKSKKNIAKRRQQSVSGNYLKSDDESIEENTGIFKSSFLRGLFG